ncbi:molecular chaperone DnaJ, partial [Synechococcus sp. GFB01]
LASRWVRRALSGGEWLALLLLAMALVLSLALGVGLAWMRGAELMAWPSWWPPS